MQASNDTGKPDSWKTLASHLANISYAGNHWGFGVFIEIWFNFLFALNVSYNFGWRKMGIVGGKLGQNGG